MNIASYLHDDLDNPIDKTKLKIPHWLFGDRQ